MIGKDLLRFNTDITYSLLDFETEGLNLYASRPWQIAWARFKKSKDISLYGTFIRWDNINVSDEAAKKTGFNRQLYMDTAKPAKEVFDQFQAEVMEPQLALCGHNVLNFDFYIYQVWRMQLGYKPDWSFLENVDIFDTLAMSKMYKLGWNIPADRAQRLAAMYRVLDLRLPKGVKVNLSAMCKELMIPFDPSKMHDALEDVAKNVDVFRALIYKQDI